MSVRHTPGPWTCYVGGHEDPGFHVYRTDGRGNGDHVACIPHDAESDANASLIAAAPDLLDALRAFCGDYESTPTTSDTSLKAAYLRALEVIAKVEGR